MRHRFPQWRLRLISIVFALVVCILFVRIVQIQIIRHDAYLKKAKKQWHKKISRPARRGSVYDRNGLPLAVTHRVHSVGVTPKHFPKKDKGKKRSLARILGVTTKELDRALGKKRAYVLLGRDLRLSEEDVELLSRLKGVRLDEGHERLYPSDAVPLRLVGKVDSEGRGVGGVELAFQDVLGGEDGWWLANKDANNSTFHAMNAPGRKPRNGKDIYLTIDSRVQSIVDFELEQAVRRCSASGGAAIVVDPYNGDILALAENFSNDSPLGFSTSHKDALYSVSCIYEPGSTFKLVTDSFLLERGDIDPYDVFYGENGKAKFEFGVFQDDHEHEWLTFKESFVLSSNICTIKAIKGADPREFYSYILGFGFSGRTGIKLPAESRGSLANPKLWSKRSLPSISIGYEIGVTALQMAMAYCALANGGMLNVPRIALETRDENGRVVERFPVLSVRRVFSEETAETIKGFCREVVEKGTGRKAAVNGIPVAGKTGTTQKAGENGYGNGKYVASFIGFAPADKPKIVCLVVLDEPEYPFYWGGESSAVAFGKIVEGINLATDLLYQRPENKIAIGCATGGRVEVPSFLRLEAFEAVRLASNCGLRIKSTHNEGVVYSQMPDPGSFTERGEEVKLLFRSGSGRSRERIRVPDIRDLSIREARRLLIACGLESRVRGFGVVRSQTPVPGKMVGYGSEVILHCRPDYNIFNAPVSLARLSVKRN